MAPLSDCSFTVAGSLTHANPRGHSGVYLGGVSAESGAVPMETKPEGLQHPDCYARALGGCSREMSGEHYVSKSILELIENRAGQKSRSVRVTGLSFQKQGVLQQFGISNLVGNILCKMHNSLLSPLDEAGKAMFLVMDGMNDGAADQSLAERVLRVDGDGLERWVLKTMCGALYSGAFKVSPTETMKGVCPPQEWLDILFNGAELPPGQGVYYMPRKPGETVTADEYVLRCEPIRSRDSNQVGAFRVWLFGFEFVLLMANLMPGVPTMFDGAIYRPAGLRAVGSGTSVRLDWKSRTRSEEIVFGLVCREAHP